MAKDPVFGTATIAIETETINKNLSPEANERVAALTEAKGILVGGSFFGVTSPHGKQDTYTADVVYLAEYILNGLEEAIVEEFAYPRVDGDYTVLAPGIFHQTGDRSVISIEGENYVPQSSMLDATIKAAQ